MKIRVFVAVLACKLSRSLIRLLGRGGTDLPGRIALKICPNLLGVLAKNVTTVIVTGTNGKTTTSRMIEQSWADAGISYFANKTGANLLSGVTAEFAVHSTAFGKCRHTHALIEADEAAFKLISRFVDPKAVVVTNVFRDQLDRYGEVTHTIDSIRLGIENSPNAQIALNGDDPLCASIADAVPNPVIFYGVDTPIYSRRVAELSDAPYCLRCGAAYEYDYVTYGHLGGYRCSKCGDRRRQTAVSVKQVLSSDAEQSQVVFTMDGADYPATINLPGGYNIYNACACMAAGKLMDLDMAVCARSLSAFSCGFGRMEKFQIKGVDVRMILIKNPAGCNQVLNFLAQQTEPFTFVICLTDRTSDGRDVSWIWDVDFERLTDMGDLLHATLFSGRRAEDMALRFRYAGFPAEQLRINKDYASLVEEAVALGKPVFIMPTYTGMLELHKTISKVYGFKQFWE